MTSGIAYTYSRYKNSSESPFYYPNKPFINGIHDEWANAQDDQRHTLTVNGNYEWRYGLSLSGLFHYGSGNAFATAVGTAQPTGYAPSTNRTFGTGVTPVPYTATGSPVTSTTCATTATNCTRVYNNPANNFLDAATGYWMTKRNALYGRNVYRMDTRLQERHKFGEKFSGVVAVEVLGALKPLQSAIGQPQTGEAWINNADATVLQQKLGITADGLFGKGSNTALQNYLVVTADGVFGPNSVKALQERLNAGTFFAQAK